MRSYCLAIMVLSLAPLLHDSASAELITFEFQNGGELDGDKGVGTTMSRSGGADTVTLETVDILTPEYDSSYLPTGATLSAAGGDGGTTGIVGSNGLAVNNPSINNSNYAATYGASQDSGQFNSDEAWVMEFDVDVILSEVDFTSFDSTDSFTIAVEGFATTYFAAWLSTSGIHTDPFGGAVIPAGADLTFTSTGPPSSNIQIDSITVDTGPFVPEPSTLALLVSAVLLPRAAGRRSRGA